MTIPQSKKELRTAIAEAMPDVVFVTKDGLGTPVPAHLLEVRVARERVPVLEQVLEPWGLKARWPICSEIYGVVRVIDVRPLLEQSPATPSRRSRP